MNEHVLAAALRLDEAVTLLRIEPLHRTCRHLSLLPSSIAAADKTRKAGPIALADRDCTGIWRRCAFWDNGSMSNRAQQSIDNRSMTAIGAVVDNGGR